MGALILNQGFMGSIPIRATEATMIPVAKRYNLSPAMQNVYDAVLDLWQAGEEAVYSERAIALHCQKEFGYSEHETMRRLESLTMREVLRKVTRFGQDFFGPHSFEQGTP